MPDPYNPYAGQQQGANGTGGYYGGAPSGYSSDDYNKQLMQQTGLPLPVGIDDQTRQNLLAQQGALAGQFAGQGQAGYNAYGQQAQGVLAALRRQASGQDSISAEQLRQSLAQQLAQQRSFAAGASPRFAAGAARTAAIQMGRASTAMAGQQALAGLAERQQAVGQQSQLLGTLRGQDLNAALQSRQNALGGYGAGNAGPPQPSWIQQYGPAIAAGAAAIAASDRALKTNIAPGDAAANTAIGSLGRPSSNPFAASSSAPQSIVPMSVSGLPASPKTSMDTFYNQVGTLDPTAPNQNTTGLDSFYGQIAGATPSTGMTAASPGGAPAAPAGPAWWQRLAGGLAAGIRAVPQYPTAYSDRLLKTGIKPGDDKANTAIDGLRPYTYAYKDPALGAGPQVGVMAQDLQKAGLGQAVVQTPIGLAIDPGKLSGANTAMIAALGRRDVDNKRMIDALERRIAELEGSGAIAAAPGSQAADRTVLLSRKGREDPAAGKAQETLDSRRAKLQELDLRAAGAYPGGYRPLADPTGDAAQNDLDRRRAMMAALARGAQLAQAGQ